MANGNLTVRVLSDLFSGDFYREKFIGLYEMRECEF